jgi:pyruvate dehydrogenase kinase 2/3/4
MHKFDKECCWCSLQIISMEGYGTDAYLHLNRLGNVQEPLP